MGGVDGLNRKTNFVTKPLRLPGSEVIEIALFYARRELPLTGIHPQILLASLFFAAHKNQLPRNRLYSNLLMARRSIRRSCKVP